MTKKRHKRSISDTEAIKNLLVVGLLKDGVDAKSIAAATGIPEGTIRRRFPMKFVKKTQAKRKASDNE